MQTRVHRGQWEGEGGERRMHEKCSQQRWNAWPAAAQEDLVWEGTEHYFLRDRKLLKDFKLEQNVIY